MDGFFDRFRGHSRRMQRLGRVFSWTARALLCFVLILLPLLWAGAHPYAIGLMELLAFLALSLYAAGAFCRLRLKLSFPVGLLFFLPALGIALLQLVPSVFPSLASETLKLIWDGARTYVTRPAVLALLPDAQIESIVALASVALLYTVMSQAFRGIERAWTLAMAVSLACAVSAYAGLIEFFGHVEWFQFVAETQRSVASAGFMNRNHFAQFSAMGFFTSVGLFASLVFAQTGSSLQIRFTKKSRIALCVVLALAAFGCFLAIVFSYSRAGILTAAGGVLVLTVLLARTSAKRVMSLPILFTTIGLALAGFYGLDTLASRVELALSGEDPSGLVRLEIWRIALDVIQASPIWGSGFDAMRSLSPMFDTGFMPGKIAFEAHNDYLELAAVFGIPYAVFAVCLGGYLWTRLAYKVLKSPRRLSSFYPLALSGLVALAVALCHEMFDYGLKHPANLLLFCAIGIYTAQLVRYLSVPREAQREANVTRLTLRSISLPLCVGVLGLLGFVMIPSGVSDMALGRTLVRLHDLQFSPHIRIAMKPEARLQEICSRAQAALQTNPYREELLFADIEARRSLVQREENVLIAEAVSAKLDRSVNARQVVGKTYREYWLTALASIAPQKRAPVIEQLKIITSEALKLASRAPIHAIELSVAAAALDEMAAFSGEARQSAKLHERALTLYPYHASILRRALRSKGAFHRTSIETLLQEAKRLCAQQPEDLTWVLPLLWTLEPRVERLVALTPRSVRGEELLSQFFVQKEEWQAALSALNTALAINASRVEPETPSSLGRVAYLMREKRSKSTVEYVLEKQRVVIYTKAGMDVERIKSEERLEQFKTKLDAVNFDYIDRLMHESQWILAQAALKKLPPSDEKAVREAEIAFAMGNSLRLSRLLERFEWRDPDDPMPSELTERLHRLQAKVRASALGKPQQ